jgi:hypothetical protein
MKSPTIQRVMEQVHEFLLQVATDINKEVTAADEIKPGRLGSGCDHDVFRAEREAVDCHLVRRNKMRGAMQLFNTCPLEILHRTVRNGVGISGLGPHRRRPIYLHDWLDADPGQIKIAVI